MGQLSDAVKMLLDANNSLTANKEAKKGAEETIRNLVPGREEKVVPLPGNQFARLSWVSDGVHQIPRAEIIEVDGEGSTPAAPVEE